MLKLLISVKKSRNHFQRFGILFGFSILFYQLFIAIGSFTPAITNIFNPYPLLIGLGLIIITFLSQMVAWQLIMKGFAVYIPWEAIVRGYTLSFLPRYLPGTIWGYFSRAEWLYQSSGVLYKKSYYGSIIEVVIAITSSILIVLIAYLYYELSITFTNLLLSIFLSGLIIWMIFQFIIKKTEISLDFPEHTIKKLVIWGESLLLYMFNGLLYGFTLFLVIHAYGISLPNVNLETCISYSAIYNISWLAGFLIVFIPSGMGFREIILIYLLHTQITIPLDIANIISITIRGLVLLSEVIFVLIGYILSKHDQKRGILRR